MKFNNPKILADALSNLDIQPDPTKSIEIQDVVVPTVQIAGSTNTVTGTTAVTPAKSDVILDRTLVQKGFQQTSTANTLYTLHTVTSGKTLYVSSMQISNGGTAQTIRAGDNISGNTNTSGTLYTDGSICLYGAAGGTIAINFQNPLKIVTALKIETSGNTDFNVSFQGWEE